jgi:hypothetical protein
VKRFCLFLFISCSLLLAADPVGFSVGGFQFERPEGWNWVVPTSPMRKAQLSISGNNSDPVEVNFFHFGPGQGGSVQANVDRWFNQFQNAETSQKETSIDGVRVIYVDASGTFLSGMPGASTTPKEKYALKGAILKDDVGGDVFVKMSGPIEVVAASGELFQSMISRAVSAKK